MRYIKDSYPPNYQQQQYYDHRNPSMNIGGQGYNNMPQQQYYGYGYQPYPYYSQYDPMEIRRRLDNEEIQRRQGYENQINIWNKLTRTSNVFSEYEDDYNTIATEYTVPVEEKPRIIITNDSNSLNKQLWKEDSDKVVEEKVETSYERSRRLYNDDVSYNHMCKLNMLKVQHEQYLKQCEQQRLHEIENYVDQIQDQNLYDFLTTTANQRYNEIREREAYFQNRNLGSLYNSPSFAELLNLHNSNPQAINPNFNIDDIEVSLPPHLKDSYNERKKQFLDAIISNNPKLGGL